MDCAPDESASRSNELSSWWETGFVRLPHSIFPPAGGGRRVGGKEEEEGGWRLRHRNFAPDLFCKLKAFFFFLNQPCFKMLVNAPALRPAAKCYVESQGPDPWIPQQRHCWISWSCRQTKNFLLGCFSHGRAFPPARCLCSTSLV